MGGCGAGCIAFEDRPRAGQRVQNLPKVRHAWALEVWRLWKELDNERYSGEIPHDKFKLREEGTLNRLVQLCAPEVVEAFIENGVYRVTGENANYCIAAGVAKAVRTVTEYRNRPIHEHVKICVVEALVERITAFDEWFYQAKPGQLLELLSQVPQLAAEALIGCMTTKQAEGVLSLLLWAVNSGRGGFYQPPLEQPPKSRADRLAQCLYVRIGSDPGIRRVTEGAAREGRKVFLLLDPDGRLKTRRRQDGGPLDLAGPIHVKMSALLSKQLSKRPDFPVRLGNINKGELGGISNMAKSLKVSRSRIRRWRGREDELPKVYHDGNGVSVNLTVDDVWHIAEIASSRKPEHS